MIEAISNIITNVLIALYQNFWFSVLAAVLFMFFIFIHKSMDGKMRSRY